MPVFDDFAYDDAGQKDIYDPSKKIGIQVSREFLSSFTIYSKGKFAARLLKDRLLLEMCGMRFSRNHRLFEAFDRKLQQLFSAGITK